MTRLSKALNKIVSSNESGYRIEFIQDGCCLLEGDQPVRAVVGFISFRQNQLAVNEAMSMFKKITFPAAAFLLDSLEPFPAKALEAFADKVHKIVVIESDATCLLSKWVRENTWIKPIVMVPPQGRSIAGRDIFEKEDWN